MSDERRLATIRNWLICLIAVVAVGTCLRLLQPVIVPVVLALCISLVVSPVERRVAALVPKQLRWLGLAAAMAVILGVLASFFAALWIGTRRIAGALNDLPSRLDQMLSQSDLQDRVIFGSDLSQLASMLGERAVNYFSGLATGLFGQASSTLVMLALTLFLVMLMLAEAPRWIVKLRHVSPGDTTARSRTTARLIAHKLRLYLMARAGLGLLTALLYAGWLWYCNVSLLLIWGMLTFLFSFIPNLGSVLSAVVPVVYALVMPDTAPVWLIALGLVAIEQVIGNFLDPRVQGQQVSLSPVVILLSVIFWGWLWGPVGAFLGVPIMVAVVVACAHIEAARPFALLLSDQSDFEGLDRVALEKNDPLHRAAARERHGGDG